MTDTCLGTRDTSARVFRRGTSLSVHPDLAHHKAARPHGERIGAPDLEARIAGSGRWCALQACVLIGLLNPHTMWAATLRLLVPRVVESSTLSFPASIMTFLTAWNPIWLLDQDGSSSPLSNLK